MTATPTRSTAAVWRPGDPVGDRRFAAVGDLALERGGVLPDVTIAYETWGTLSPSGDNAVLVEHALTGDSHVVGDAGPGHPSPGWWPGLIGPGRRSTPTTCSSSRATCSAGARARPGRPPPTRRPAVGRPVPVRHHPRPGRRRGRARRRARHPALARRPRRLDGRHAGARVGGRPPRPRRACAGARLDARTRRPTRSPGASRSCSPSAPTRPSAAATTTTSDEWPVTGMGIARRIAHITYRHEAELDDRFGRRPQGGEDPLGVAAGATTSRATSTTTPASWPAASTRTATSC